ncbi:hypothetical protein [Streptomyces formicae]|uniref:Putative integral membrane protein n=1 Tax=Streptomyces formicae TaxID=1616117 RepID=A0A291QFE7_9ACTN|nr:hypothetical protein [Streptomyces formicae]ATL30439.1 putative integral membrane protein [Streptomyces formicae]
MTTTWHVTAANAARYAAGDLPDTDAWSLEKHVEVCGRCAPLVTGAVRRGPSGPDLAAVRGAVLSAVQGSAESPAPSPLPGSWQVFRAVGPALRGPWLVALVTVCAGAVGLAYATGFHGARTLLLALSPVLPLVGVAVSYGPHADPVHELAASTPSGGLRLLLTRTLAVLAVSLPLLTAAGAAAPGTGGAPGPAAWLLPGLALTVAALVLGSYVGCRAATATVAAGWLLAVLAPVLAGPDGGTGVLPVTALNRQLAQYLAGPGAQSCWAAAAVLGAALLALRRHSFDLEKP